MSEEKCRLCTKLKSDHFELSNGYASWKYCDDPTDKDLWYKNACRKFEQSKEPVPTAMTEPIEKITDDTRVEVTDDGQSVSVRDIAELYHAMVLTFASKEARIKELEEKLKVAEEALNGISVLALSRPNAEIIADEALKKLKG